MASDGPTLARWRRHPAFERVSMWLEAHAYYVQRMDELTAAGGRLSAGGRAAARQLLVDLDEFDSFLHEHSAREERGMFAYLAATFPGKFSEAARKLAQDHATYAARAEALRSGLRSEQLEHAAIEGVCKGLAAWQAALLAHFRVEEETCVPMLLDLTASQHAEYQRQVFGRQLSAGEAQAAESFPGRGRSLREAAADGDAAAAEPAEPVAPVQLVVDQDAPTTTLRVRLLGGSSATVRANKANTVGELEQHVAWLCTTAAAPFDGSPFVLHTAFPARSLAKERGSTLEAAGLLHAALTQVAMPSRVASSSSASSGLDLSAGPRSGAPGGDPRRDPPLAAAPLPLGMLLAAAVLVAGLGLALALRMQ